MEVEIIGLDVGGVIMDKANDKTDTSFFTDNYLRTTPTSHMWDVVPQLVARFRPERSFIVSKCGKNIQRKTLEWMDHHRFYERTGIPRDHVHFCKHRAGKAPICEELGITHFVDDRMDVLCHLASVRRRYLFAPGDRQRRLKSESPGGITLVESWLDVQADIIG